MKNTLLIFALLWALGASGQIYINSYAFGAAPSATLLLDDYPNAAAAYSLRKLRTAYTGDCIVVRRSSNNDTLAIGFSGNYLDTVALKMFCASTNCFVQTWYDQSGNARNATQSTSANQPQIVSSGSLILQNGKTSVQFDGSNDFLNRSQSASNLFAANFSVFFVHNVTGGSIRKFLIETTSVNSDVYNPSLEYNQALFPTSIRLFCGEIGNTHTTVSTNTFNGNTQRLVSALKNGTTIQEIFVNNASQGSTSPSGTPTIGITGYNIGTFRSANERFFGGNMQEIILYNSYESSNRTGIESNINSFYTIY